MHSAYSRYTKMAKVMKSPIIKISKKTTTAKYAQNFAQRCVTDQLTQMHASCMSFNDCLLPIFKASAAMKRIRVLLSVPNHNVCIHVFLFRRNIQEKIPLQNRTPSFMPISISYMPISYTFLKKRDGFYSETKLGLRKFIALDGCWLCDVKMKYIMLHSCAIRFPTRPRFLHDDSLVFQETARPQSERG